MNELVEYTKPDGDGYEAGSEFDDGDVVIEKAPAKPVTKVQPKASPVSDFEDSDIPF